MKEKGGAFFTEHFGNNPLIVQLGERYDALLEKQNFDSKLSPQETVALFVTLSPEPDIVNAYGILEYMKRIAVKKGVSSMIWSVENYGVQSEHVHCHAVIVLDKTTQNGQRNRMKNTIVNVCKKLKTKSDAYLDIKPVSEKKLKDKVAYVKGEKVDQLKLQGVMKDKEWRKGLGLKDYYVYPEIVNI